MTKVVRITAQPRNPVTGETTTLRLAGAGNRKGYFYGGNHWRAGLADLPRFRAAIGYDEAGWTGAAVPATAPIAWMPSNKAALSELAAFHWPGAAITLEEGDEETEVFTVRLTGKIADAPVQGGRLIITAADLAKDLGKDLVTARFAGTGGAEGGTEAKGRIKRRSWGRVFNVEGHILDKANNIYEFGDPAYPLQSFEVLRDMGRDAAPAPAVIAWQGSVAATLAALAASVPVQGSGVVAPSIACVKWWTQPAGPLTADIKGEVGAGYVETAPSIAERVLGAAGGPAVTNTAAANGWRGDVCGLHVGENDSVASAIDRLLLPVSLLWIVDPAGTVTLREITFTGPVATLQSDSVNRLRTLSPVKTRRVGYQKSHRLHNDGEIAASLLQLDAAAAAQLAASVASLAAIADDGKIAKGEKAQAIKDDKDIRSRYHGLLSRAAAIGILAATQNLLLYSEQFDNAAWAKASAGTGASNPVPTANAAVAPNLTTTADRITFNRGTGTTSASYSVVNQATASIASGTAVSGGVFLRSANGQKQNVLVYLERGGTAYGAKIFEVGPDWVQIEANMVNPSTGAVYLVFGTRAGAGFGGDQLLDLHVWGGQADPNRFLRPYVGSTSAAVVQAAAGTVADAAYTALSDYRDSIEHAYPSFYDANVDTTLFPADNMLGSPLDVSVAPWSNPNLTVTKGTGNDSGYWLLDDVSGAQAGDLRQNPTINPALTYTMIAPVKKDAVTSRFPVLFFWAVGTGDPLSGVSLNTSTGAYAVPGSNAVAVGSTQTVVDGGVHWIVVAELPVTVQTAVYVQVYPTYSATLGGGFSNAPTGSILVGKIVLFQGSLASTAGASFRNRANALSQRLEELRRAISEAAPNVEVPGSIQIDANAGGSTTTVLPLTARCKCFVGGVDQSANANWVLGTLPSGISATINNTAGHADRGVISVSTADTAGNLTVNCTPPGYSETTKQVPVTRAQAAAPSGGGAGSPYVSDSSFPNVASGTLADISDIMTIRSTAAGTLIFSAFTRHLPSAGSNANVMGIKARYRTTAGPGAWNDLAAEVTGSANGTDPENGQPTKGAVSISDTTKTGLTASTDYDVVLQGRRFSGADTLVLSNSTFTVRQVA